MLGLDGKLCFALSAHSKDESQCGDGLAAKMAYSPGLAGVAKFAEPRAECGEFFSLWRYDEYP
jgi:hypothetical protein